MSSKHSNTSKRYLHPMPSFHLTVCLLISVVLSSSACSTHPKHSSQPANSQQANAGVPGKPSNFSWELAGLPACYDARDGAEVFVWRSQKTMICDTASGKWTAGGAP